MTTMQYSLPLAIGVKRDDFRYVYFNAEAKRVLHQITEEVVGKTDSGICFRAPTSLSSANKRYVGNREGNIFPSLSGDEASSASANLFEHRTIATHRSGMRSNPSLSRFTPKRKSPAPWLHRSQVGRL